MQSLTYGYMRVFCDDTEERVRSLEQRLRQCSEERGLDFVTTFHETVSGSQEVLYELIEEVKRTAAGHVVAPSFRHFSRNELLQNVLLSRLEEGAGVEVHTLSEWASRQVHAADAVSPAA